MEQGSNNSNNSHIDAITDLLNRSERRTALANEETARAQAQVIDQANRMRELEERMVTGFNVMGAQLAHRQDDTEGAFKVEN